jgi:hypothetical protein
LFIAGTLSQLALMQPLSTFLQDDLGWSHRKAVLVTSTVIFLAAHVPILGLTSGALHESDFGPAPSGARSSPSSRRSCSSGSFGWSAPGMNSTEGRRFEFPGSSGGCSRMSRLYTYWCCSQCRPCNTAPPCLLWRACRPAISLGDGGQGFCFWSFSALSALRSTKPLSQKPRQHEINDAFRLAVPHDVVGGFDRCHGVVFRQNLARALPA